MCLGHWSSSNSRCWENRNRRLLNRIWPEGGGGEEVHLFAKTLAEIDYSFRAGFYKVCGCVPYVYAELVLTFVASNNQGMSRKCWCCFQIKRMKSGQTSEHVCDFDLCALARHVVARPGVAQDAPVRTDGVHLEHEVGAPGSVQAHQGAPAATKE